MDHFGYKVSVIVPVYNVEAYLRKCLDSLLAQTIDHDDMEVLLINDGSTDGSLEICQGYAKLFSVFKVFSKENEGLSATRNYGIRRAMGKYLMYLDSDDMLTPETVKSVTDFFDTVYDEVDLVTYLDQPYKNGEKMKSHFRYDYLQQTGIYDLKEYPYICQTRINICVKNLFEKNPMFDTTPDFRHEDQEYCNRILMKKQKIGFCDKGEYQYLRNDSSITSVYMFPLYIFQTTMHYFEKLFNEYENERVPVYLQAMFVHDISWKLKENILFPYHYEGERYAKEFSRITALLDRIDDSTLLDHPSTDTFHRHFFLNLKSDAKNAVVTAMDNEIAVYKNGYLLYSAKKLELILNTVKIRGNRLQMLAFLKSPVFNYIEELKIEAVVSYNNGTIEKMNLEFFLSSWSWYKTKEKTNNFYGFYFNCNADDVRSFKIQIIVDGMRYDTYYWFMPTAPYSNKAKQYKAILSDYIVEFRNNAFFLTHMGKYGILDERKNLTDKISEYPELYGIRAEADRMADKKIWLYYDCRGVERDNGYYQFVHDFEKQDGVERFYIDANENKKDEHLFTGEMKEHVVPFGSLQHKILYVAATKIITAYVEDKNINPFESDEKICFADILNFDVIYLQHGILHAHLPWKYSPGRIDCDKIVISSWFEKENFTRTYHFLKEALIECGMPRFDHINTNAEAKNRILFAPSWRNYLIGSAVGNSWTLTENKFIDSDYYKVFNEFLNSPRLEQILAENDLYLDFKIHPIFRPYLRLFDNSNEHIHFAGNSVRDEEYAAFITDFSSFVFDFACLGRPIIYFVPDHLQFRSGMNQYRELDLPFEKAFGNLVTDSDSAISELHQIINRNFVPDPVFAERMDQFYLPLKDCSERLYQYLIMEEG